MYNDLNPYTSRNSAIKHSTQYVGWKFMKLLYQHLYMPLYCFLWIKCYLGNYFYHKPNMFCWKSEVEGNEMKLEPERPRTKISLREPY